MEVYCRIESTVEAVVMLVLEPVLKGRPPSILLAVRLRLSVELSIHESHGMPMRMPSSLRAFLILGPFWILFCMW